MGFRAFLGPIFEKLHEAKHKEISLFGPGRFLVLDQGRNTKETICFWIAWGMMILLLWEWVGDFIMHIRELLEQFWKNIKQILQEYTYDLTSKYFTVRGLRPAYYSPLPHIHSGHVHLSLGITVMLKLTKTGRKIWKSSWFKSSLAYYGLRSTCDLVSF